jgi:hypothetical protein
MAAITIDGMMTGIIMRGPTGGMIAIMIGATTRAMTVITMVVTPGGIAIDITMTVTPGYGARIETITPIDDIAMSAGNGERILKTRVRVTGTGPW